MKALFRVTIRNHQGKFTAENVLASSAGEAAKLVEADTKKTFKSEECLYASDVEMLGEVTVES